ncbi:MAG: deoxyribose-phosphate aldolase [Planctomycetota bacterium]|jgi:deoxyribose-phosphate aldolase|nr:deoxyribose-phosphate aldolase [Planctomycetota bacterium]
MPETKSGRDPGYAKYIDHTVLKPETTRETLKRFCDEAKAYGFASVCVNPANIKYVAGELAGSGVVACSVVGFPLGASLPEVKAFETERAVADGAGEIDMVINVGALKDGDFDFVEKDIAGVVRAAGGKPVKVIMETCLLTDREKVEACKRAERAGAAFVKTSTGFGSGGATVGDVRLMRAAVGPKVQVKASTGVNNRRLCDAFIAAGATRMGTSKGIKIVDGNDE